MHKIKTTITMLNNLFDLSGKIALVTGATHKMGMAIAKTLTKAGVKIAVNDISDKELDDRKVSYKRRN